ncbi:MAG: hypothetical protein RMJ82_13935, partial [Gemmatales bacterium]|nr:hypothetical protein [Gemmatales bacterium]
MDSHAHSVRTRHFSVSPVSLALCVLILAWITACHKSPPPPAPKRSPRNPELALAEGVKFLLQRQAEDGAWRSEYYATFRDGTALTPLVLLALQYAHDSG